MKKYLEHPLAYFITFTCYGTWLHGTEKASVDRKHNIPQTEFLFENKIREKSVKQRMAETSYLLDKTHREIVLDAIKEVCVHDKWVLLAAHVRTNHVHLVLHTIKKPEYVMNKIKAYASRCLNESQIDNGRSQRWTRHGSTRYLWNECEVEATIRYVVHEQGKPMAVFENIKRSFEIMYTSKL